MHIPVPVFGGPCIFDVVSIAWFLSNFFPMKILLLNFLSDPCSNLKLECQNIHCAPILPLIRETKNYLNNHSSHRKARW
jgi:hypothetical protein